MGIIQCCGWDAFECCGWDTMSPTVYLIYNVLFDVLFDV